MRLLRTMRRPRRLLPVVVCAATLAAAGIGWAYFTSASTGTATAVTGSLASPSDVTGSASGSNVAVSWTGVADPGPGTFGYYVTRTPYPSGTAVAVCGSSPLSLLPAAPTSCSDTSAPNGTYSYTVTAVYNSFSSSRSSGPVVVAVAPSAGAPAVAATTTYASGGIVWVNHENVTLTDSPSTNGGPAVTSVSYYSCLASAAPCSSSNWTLIGSSTAGGNWSQTWASTSLPADQRYDVVATATNASSLTSPVSAGTAIGIDTTPPSVSPPSVNGFS
jgi:hypothetical protein